MHSLHDESPRKSLRLFAFATKKLDGVIVRRALPDEAISRSEMRLGINRADACRYATNDTEYSFFLSEQRITSCGDTQFDKHNVHI